jgi:hypothetical protein
MSALDTQYSTVMILAYVPEAEEMSFELAETLAFERDAQAAADLQASAESQLHLEEAARVANAALDGFFTGVN